MDYSLVVNIDIIRILEKLLTKVLRGDESYEVLNRNIQIHVMKVKPCLERKEHKK